MKRVSEEIMAGIEPRYSKEEFARRGDEIYERVVRGRVEGEDERKFVLIDIETEDFEVDADEIAASNRLLARHPDGQVWMRRVGSRYARSSGGRTFGSKFR
jgi:U3 small nucleolar RNA-associated protein 14